MHPRNPYEVPPNFLELAQRYTPLQVHLIPSGNGATIDFHDIHAQKCLTQALLHRDFGLKLTIPDDRLCPPIPNRLNYILWLQDLMAATDSGNGQQRPVTGLDIGTGASSIYPLLGCATNKHWQFIATDIDDLSLQYARANVLDNGLEQRIKILPTVASGPIFPAELLSLCPQLDFSMCNPPFYADREEVLRSAEAKEFGPNAVCTGAENEMITPGGEVAFVGKMIKESLSIRARCRWYSSMLGKMSSLTQTVELLREEKIGNFAITEFVQGKTRRWALAWSFTDEHLPDSLARISNPALQNIMPERTCLKQSFPAARAIDEILRALHSVLETMDGVKVETCSLDRNGEADVSSVILVHASGNTWSRAARRKKPTDKSITSSDSPTALVCRMHVEAPAIGSVISPIHTTIPGQKSQPVVVFQWVRGVDRTLFESFMSHVSRKVLVAVKSSNDEMRL